jgi:hypothetical protein
MDMLIVISYYFSRPDKNLFDLLLSLKKVFAGRIVVIVNSDNNVSWSSPIDGVVFKYNKNVGMNIGAWNRGYLDNPDANFYLFLQDECFVKRADFFYSILAKFESEPDIGLLGESINCKWDIDWATLSESALNSLEADHLIDDRVVRRVDMYLHMMRFWGVNPGSSGRHLRSLVWALPGRVMRELGGFPIGQNKGECIASEIAVSRKIVNLGYRVEQFDLNPFTFFGHREWRADGLSKIY